MRWDRTHGNLGSRNQRAVMEEIVLRGPVSRTEIAQRLDLSVASVSRIVSPLLNAGLVRVVQEVADDTSDAGPGRRHVYLDVDPGGGTVLGIRIGPTFQTLVLSDLKNRLLSGTELKLERLDDPDIVIRRVADESRRMIDRNVEDRSRFLGGFLMIAGSVDRTLGSVRYSHSLGWRDVPLRSKLIDILDLPMRVESMTTTFALAETRFGAVRGQNNVLALVCSLQIGASLLLDGRLIEGYYLATGGIGNMMVTGKNGKIETLNSLASGYGILRRIYGDEVLSGMSVREQTDALLDSVERDRDGDPAMAALMTEAGYALGWRIAQFLHLVAPQSVVVAGPLAVSSRYVGALRDAVDEMLGTATVNIVTSGVVGPISGQSATCGMAICEYLFGNPAQDSP